MMRNNELGAILLHRNYSTLRAILFCEPAIANRPASVTRLPIEIALYGHDIDALRVLLSGGADIHVRGEAGIPIIESVMMEACDEHDIMNLRLLLQAGLDPDARILEGGRTLLMRAVWGTPDVVKLLLDYGANLNARDQKGWTALMYAAEYDIASYVDPAGIEIVRTLIAAGADTSIRNFDGITAKDIANKQEADSETLHRIQEALESMN